MSDPFIIHTDSIRDHSLRKIATERWVEETLPTGVPEVDYLKPSLRVSRMRVAVILFFAIFVLLLARSAQLQIAEASVYQQAASRNRLRIAQIPAPRGVIADRNGVPLTRNVPRFQIILHPLDLPSDNEARESALERLSESAEIPMPEIKKYLETLKVPVSPLILKRGFTLQEVYPLIIATQDIPGVIIEPVSVREYPYGEILGHILGYLGPIDEKNQENYLQEGYALNDYVGKTGLELTLEAMLRGKPGRRYVEVDARGNILTTSALDEPVGGQTVRLTIDYELQRKAHEVLKAALTRLRKEKGALIIIAPHSGEILALVSYPSFDNNIFGAAKNPDAASALLKDPKQPLFPRAISGTYPSGSVIKPAVAAAALEEKIIGPHTSFVSVGGLRVGQWFFPDWRAGGHGLTDVRKALAESVNTFFYIVGGGYEGISGLGIERLAGYLKRFGFGSITGLELPGENSGLIPTPQWKEEKKGERWYVGDTYHLTIGQGDILVTPLQIARMTAYFASGGEWTRPHLVIEPPLNLPLTPTPLPQASGSESHPARRGEGRVRDEGEKEGMGPQIYLQNIQIVREGLRDAVRYGSARSLQALPATSAGKTGTAQWSSTKEPHAWFTGWAPYESPEIVVTVLIEEGKEGSSAATPVAREIFEWWFTRAQEH